MSDQGVAAQHTPPAEDGGTSEAAVPLVVDLEGALLRTDLEVESVFLMARQQPLRLPALPFRLARGTACVKRELARSGMPDVATLPYRREVITRLEAEKRRGASIVLLASADQAAANLIADHLQLFDRVLASDGTDDLAGDRRRARLLEAFGLRGFDYLGGTRADPAVEDVARRVTLLAAEEERADPAVYLLALRPHQWLKNALVLVPLIAAHRLYDGALLAQGLLAILAFSLAASSAYLINDLMDLPSDRHHPRKRERPMASGRLSPRHGAAMIPVLLAASIVTALLVPAPFLAVLGLYYLLTLGYSMRLKDIVILDVLTLAGLYALRVIAGSTAVGIPPSAWLLAFCVFLFFSLAMVKRYAELVAMRAVAGARARARAYLLEDAELLAALGGASGYLAVLVLAFYITTEAAPLPEVRYHPIWLVCLLLLYWISYMWLMAHRGRMHDDPMIFALRDRVSQALMVLAAVILFIAT